MLLLLGCCYFTFFFSQLVGFLPLHFFLSFLLCFILLLCFQLLLMYQPFFLSFFFLFLLLQKFFVSAICRPCTAKQCWSNCHIDCLTVSLSSHIVFHQSHSINCLFS